MASSGNIKQITLPNGNTYDINAVTVNGHTVETDVPSGAVFTDTTYTAATANPKMDGTVAVGTSTKYAREDHVHPSDTSRVPTTRKVNNKALSADITLAASDVGAIATSAKGAASGVAELDANGKVPSSQLPSFVDDVLEYNGTSSFPSTGEAGKIYVDTSTNKTYRWGGSSYTEISASLALGETSSTAYRGDRGKTAYTHATDSSRLTTATSSGLYKVAATAQGHIASLTAVTKDDITGLGIPGSDTNTKYGLSISGHTVSLVEGGTTASVTVPDNNDNNAVTQTATTTSANYEVLFSSTADNTTRTEGARKNSNLTFNPSTGNLAVTQINGVTVGSSPKFTDNNTKYGLSISGHTVSLVEGGTTASVTVPDNNDNNAVTQTATTTSADYEVLFSSTADNTTRTEGARKNSNLKFNPSTGNLQVTKINGVDVGSSPKFTDNNTTYGLSISGHDISLVAGGTTSSVTVPDDDTWTAMTGATSSANGTVGYVNATPPKDGYNTKFLRADATWDIPLIGSVGITISSNSDLNSYTTPGVYYSPNSTVSGTITNAPTTGAGFKLYVERGYQTARIYQSAITASSDVIYRRMTDDSGSNWKDWNMVVRSTANSAVGSTTNPVYINGNGVVKTTTYSLNATVPSDAKFTDTTYTANTTSIGSASGWSTGTPASASVANGVLTITNGTKPALTVTSTTVATGITAS